MQLCFKTTVTGSVYKSHNGVETFGIPEAQLSPFLGVRAWGAMEEFMEVALRKSEGIGWAGLARTWDIHGGSQRGAGRLSVLESMSQERKRSEWRVNKTLCLVSELEGAQDLAMRSRST